MLEERRAVVGVVDQYAVTVAILRSRQCVRHRSFHMTAAKTRVGAEDAF